MRPDTVTVGDPFVFVVSVEVPAEARVEWPTVTDTAAVVALREPVRVVTRGSGETRTEIATYALAAWDVGTLAMGLPDAIVRSSDRIVHVPMSAARVVVTTVLPGDTTMRKPKPAKALFPRLLPWWQRWWPALAVVAGLLLLRWLWSRRRQTRAERVRETLDVYQRALHDFERLERLALVEAGEAGRYVALAVEVLRLYVSARFPGASLARTTTELLNVLADDVRVPMGAFTTLLDESDRIKFAHRDVTPVAARGLVADAKSIVEQIERAEQVRLAAIEAERAASERAERAEAEAMEADARRRSRRAKSGAA